MGKRRSDSRRSNAAIISGGVAHGCGEGNGAPRLSNALEIEMVCFGGLTQYPNNSRKHTRRQTRALKAAVRYFGFIVPIPIDASTDISCEHLRTKLTKNLGYGDVPVVRAGRPE